MVRQEKGSCIVSNPLPGVNPWVSPELTCQVVYSVRHISYDYVSVLTVSIGRIRRSLSLAYHMGKSPTKKSVPVPSQA